MFACWLSFAVLLQVLAGTARAADGKREIDALIAGLGVSGCEFERNGRWYDAGRAQAHLRRKYEYLDRRGLADSAEHFIERAASASSFSGKAYHVRCPGRVVVESDRWFRMNLQRLRAKPKPASTR